MYGKNYTPDQSCCAALLVRCCSVAPSQWRTTHTYTHIKYTQRRQNCLFNKIITLVCVQLPPCITLDKTTRQEENARARGKKKSFFWCHFYLFLDCVCGVRAFLVVKGHQFSLHPHPPIHLEIHATSKLLVHFAHCRRVEIAHLATATENGTALQLSGWWWFILILCAWWWHGVNINAVFE